MWPSSTTIGQNICRTSLDGLLNSDAWDVMQLIPGVNSSSYAPAGVKDVFNQGRKRSVFVNGMVNGFGGFAVIDKVGALPNGNFKYSSNPNKPGVSFAVDIDGNIDANGHCQYEQENDLLNWCTTNLVDEINLYNVSRILSHGSDLLVNASAPNFPTGNNVQEPSSNSINNNLQETETAEWHLARFIYTTKQLGIDVNAILPIEFTDDKLEHQFYHFQIEQGDRMPVDIDDELCSTAVQFAMAGNPNGNNSGWAGPQYIKYDESPIQVLPTDELGRISDIDKAIIDIYNYTIFNYRVSEGIVVQRSPPCSNIPTSPMCDKIFDGMLMEREWWTKANPDVQLDLLVDLKQFAQCLALKLRPICEPKIYTVAHVFSNPSWPTGGYTEQQRADIVDTHFERIYLYSYHKNPCDCYNGTNSALEKEFDHKQLLLRNNNLGAIVGALGNETDIYPVFQAEFHDDTRWSDDRDFTSLGCGSASGVCDYCVDYSGRFLNDLHNNWGVTKKIGFVENIFQKQYDLDDINNQYHSTYGENHINGYAWFKSSALRNENVSGKTTNVNTLGSKPVVAFEIYPNPATDEMNITTNGNVKKVMIYDVLGKLHYQSVKFTSVISVKNLESGLYFVALIYNDDSIQTKKITVK